MPTLKNINHEKFCQEYVKNERNGKRAYELVYGTKRDNVLEANASRLLSNVKIKDRVSELLTELTSKNLATPDRIIKEYARIAFLDIRKFFDSDGNLKKITDLDDDTAAAIAGMDVSALVKSGNKEEAIAEIIKKIKSVDKKGALDSLAKINGMFVDKLEVEVKKILLDV